MQGLQFRASGLNRRLIRRWRRATRAASTATRTNAVTTTKLVVATICVLPVLYAINHPREFEITSPRSGPTIRTAVAVKGTVGNERVRAVLLEVNGSSRVVPVEQGEFTSRIDLRQGSNRIQAVVPGLASHLGARSNLVQVEVITPKLDEQGNPIRDDLTLARDDEFRGRRLLAWGTWYQVTQNIFTQESPLWTALRKQGFEVVLQTAPFDPAWLEDADQLWIFSGKSSLSPASYDAIVAFVNAGKGLYALADNDPVHVPANDLAKRLFGAQIMGDYRGQRLLAVRDRRTTEEEFKRREAGAWVADHPLLSGVNFLYEGFTVAHIPKLAGGLQTALTASDGKTLVAVSTLPGQRVVIDCAWTRYWDPGVGESPGTIRFAENVAAWLMGKEY